LKSRELGEDQRILLSYRTAISRNKPSAPMRHLSKENLLVGRCLDFGSGKGFDADYYGMDKYDVYYWPIWPVGKYDTIACVYVLNVLPLVAQKKVMLSILDLLKVDGNAYVTVRRDVPILGTETQSYVILNCPNIIKNKRYEIYRIGKEYKLEEMFKIGAAGNCCNGYGC